MLNLRVGLKNLTCKYAFIFILTGLLIGVYALLIAYSTMDLNLEKNFSTKGLFLSKIFVCVGAVEILIGLVYLVIYFRNKLSLVDSATIKNYWYTLPFIIMVLSVPLLEKFVPLDKYENTMLSKIIDVCNLISVILFICGVYYFFYNLIKSTYAYLLIKGKWN